MIIKLKTEIIEDIKQNGIFTADGCACGDFVYKLDDKLWISVYRSCFISSSTPDEKLWQLHEVQFYDNITFSYFERDGKSYIDDIEEYGNFLENIKLNNSDKEILYEILKEKTKEYWGNEYKNKD